MHQINSAERKSLVQAEEKRITHILDDLGFGLSQWMVGIIGGGIISNNTDRLLRNYALISTGSRYLRDLGHHRLCLHG